ncbi:MAG: hypothetical protein IT288_04580 [Bdellovibrionales bacterium]|nr:hypothetical protein [Bdellovibrionales bacterium]
MSSRRGFLKAGLMAGSALTIESCANPLLRETPRDVFGGKLLCYGTNGASVLRKNLPGSLSGAPKFSIQGVFDFSTMTSTSTPVPFDFAHSMTQLSPMEWLVAGGGGLGWGEQLFFFNPRTQKVLHTVPVGSEFGLSGHVYVDENKIVAPLAALDSEKKPYPGVVPGKLLIVDRKTRKRRDVLDADGVLPHDVQYLPNQNLVAISYYGGVLPGKTVNPLYEGDNVGSKVVLYNPDSMTKVKEFPCPRNAFFSHFSVSSSGMLYLPTARYAKFSQEALNELEARSGQKLPVAFASSHEVYEKRIALPEPVIVLNPVTGATTELMSEPLKQRRPQSITWHKESDSIYITYPFSDTIMRIHESSGKVSYIAAQELGLYDVRGVTGIKNSRLVAVVGGLEGVVVFDPDAVQVVQRFTNKTYWAIHLFQI